MTKHTNMSTLLSTENDGSFVEHRLYGYRKESILPHTVEKFQSFEAELFRVLPQNVVSMMVGIHARFAK